MISASQRQVPFDPGSLGRRIYFCRTVLMADREAPYVAPSERETTFMSRSGIPTQTIFGALLARRLKRDRAIPAATISRWESDSARPDLETIQAIARLAKVDPGWLAYGSASSAATPIDHLSENERRYVMALAQIAEQDQDADRQIREIRRTSLSRIREMTDALPKRKLKNAKRRLTSLKRRVEEIEAIPESPAKVRAKERLLSRQNLRDDR